MNQPDIIIIGGGICGLLSARELANAGARVSLLERQSLARESSWAGGGILSPLKPWQAPQAVTALCRWSQPAYPQLAQALLDSTGTDPEWTQSGLLFADCSEREQAQAWARAQGYRHECPTQQAVRQSEPKLHAELANPLLLPDIGQVRNPRLLRALRAELTRLGVTLLEHHAVDQIKLKDGQVQGVICGTELRRANQYVIATGAWTGLLARGCGLGEMPIAPVKGEMLIFDAPPGLLRHMVLSQGRYLIPRRDGKILAGSTVEQAQFNKSTTMTARDTLQDFAHGLLPELRRYPVEKHWAGLRPGSPDGIPTIGPHPELSNLFFNCGHFRNGFVMAPASARLLADHVLARPKVVPPEPYLPRG